MKKISSLILGVSCCVLGSVSSVSWACSAFSFEAPVESDGDELGRHVAYSFDWPTVGKSVGFLGQAGRQKKSFQLNVSGEKIPGVPATWTSSQVSIAFSIVARDFAMSGMNLSGVSVSMLQLPERAEDVGDNVSEQTSKIPFVVNIQIPQYLLDTASTKAIALAQLRKVRLVETLIPLHFFICSRTDGCAVARYENEQWIFAEDLPLAVVSNDPYETSLRAYQSKSRDVDSRFSIGADILTKLPVSLRPRSFFQAQNFGIWGLGQMRQDISVWNVVYSLSDQSLLIRDVNSGLRFDRQEFTQWALSDYFKQKRLNPNPKGIDWEKDEFVLDFEAKTHATDLRVESKSLTADLLEANQLNFVLSEESQQALINYQTTNVKRD